MYILSKIQLEHGIGPLVYKTGDEFLSNYLEVNNKASNLACKAELGRLPLVIPNNEKIIKYVIDLNNKDNDSIVKQSILLSKNLHSVNNSGFYSNFMNMVEQNNPSTLDPDQAIRKQHEREIYIFLATQPRTFKEIRIL